MPKPYHTPIKSNLDGVNSRHQYIFNSLGESNVQPGFGTTEVTIKEVIKQGVSLLEQFHK